MRLRRQMIDSDRERPAVGFGRRRWPPGGTQRVAEVVSDIAVPGL